MSLLKPLIRTPSGDASPVSSPIVDGVALGGLGVALPGSISMDNLTGESGAFGAAGTLDDVVTYIHLATVVSASEYKGASLRWWNAAWSLARELKLGRELPHNAPSMNPHGDGNELDADERDREAASAALSPRRSARRGRRIWWLVYVVDRHLALCYNRPLFLLDVECDGLLQPMDDTDYQNGNFHAYTDPNVLASDPNTARICGIAAPTFECSGRTASVATSCPSMAILGEIVDLHHAPETTHASVSASAPRGSGTTKRPRSPATLEAYERSLKKFEQRHLSLSAQVQSADEKMDARQRRWE